MTEENLPTSETTNEEEQRCLVFVDNSQELERALYYACRRARRFDGRVVLLYCTEQPESEHFIQFLGISNRLEEESREEAEQLLHDLAEKTFQWSKKHAIVIIEEDVKAALPQLLAEENVSNIIQPMPSKENSSESWGRYLLEEGADALHIPVTMIPATMTIEEINKLT